MIHIQKASADELALIRDIAYKTWPDTYGEIVSKAQLDYMLTLFYSDQKLQQNFDDGHQFYIARDAENPVGFIAFEHKYLQKAATHIHKIYILPTQQGSGIGRRLIEVAESDAVKNGSRFLTLNVNRSNTAQQFYGKLGFEIEAIVDIELDHGYLMEDYIMRKPIS